jgi:hypothetical protein
VRVGHTEHTARILTDTVGSEPNIGDEVPILVNPGNRYIAVLSGFRGQVQVSRTTYPAEFVKSVYADPAG